MNKEQFDLLSDKEKKEFLDSCVINNINPSVCDSNSFKKMLFTFIVKNDDVDDIVKFIFILKALEAVIRKVDFEFFKMIGKNNSNESHIQSMFVCMDEVCNQMEMFVVNSMQKLNASDKLIKEAKEFFKENAKNGLN